MRRFAKRFCAATDTARGGSPVFILIASSADDAAVPMRHSRSADCLKMAELCPKVAQLSQRADVVPGAARRVIVNARFHG